MPKAFVAHLPHLAFVAAGVIAYFWAGLRRPRPPAGARSPARVEAAPSEPPRLARRARSARRSVARRGLLAVGPLVAAAATGAVLYGVNLGRGRVPGGVVWVHVGISLLALLLVAYKLADIGVAGLREALTRQRPSDLLAIVLSLLLGALLAPLLITGIVLLLAPGGGSFAAYLHLVLSAWWTGLLLWHLGRYVRPALRALVRPGAPGVAR